MSEYDFQKIENSLAQIEKAMERLSPPPVEYPDFESTNAFVWKVSTDHLQPVLKVSKINLDLLLSKFDCVKFTITNF